MAAGGVPQFASIYVGDLHLDVTEAMLYEIFNSVGPVASIRICRDNVSRKSLGYGYVNFHSVGDAERALDTLNYSSIKGRSCRIMWSQRDPSLRKSGAGNIHIKNLDKNIDNKALYDTFSLFGNILSCKVASDPQGNSFGYGFVQYETEEAGKQAIERVNGMQIGEKTVEVCQFVKRDARDQTNSTFTNLYVKYMPEEWGDEAKLNEVFGKYGNVTSTCVRTDPKGRKFAFVNFETHDAAEAAIDGLHMKMETGPKPAEGEEEKDADGHPMNMLFVQKAQSKKERMIELKSKLPQTDNSSKSAGVNLYIKNLDEKMEDADLKELFEPFGGVTSAVVKKDENGLGKGFGFVCFASPDEATKAVTEMHLKVVKGKPLYVGLAEKKEAREERLRQRYSAPGGKDGKGGKGKGGKGGKGGMMGGMPGGKGGMMGGMGGMMGGMGGMMGGMPGGQMNPMMGGMNPMMGGMNPMMGGMKGGPMMGGMNPQMMGMMGKGGPMPMMGKGGPGGPAPAMGGKPGPAPNMMGGKGPMMGPMGMNPMMGMMGKGGPGGMPMMPQQQMMRPPAGAMPQQQAPAPGGGLNAAQLAAAPPSVQKQMLGEKLYPAISKMQPELAGKITGMMLEMDNSELLIMLESEQQLKIKVDEALRVLQK